MNSDEETNHDSEGTFYQVEDDDICDIHKDISTIDRFHYSYCIYCIMDRKKIWNESWDDWGEVAERSVNILKMAYEDYLRGVEYCSTIETTNNNVKSFRNIYKMGQDLARHK